MIAVSVFFVGMATSNAYAMLVMSATALVLMAVFPRRRLASGPSLVTLVVAVVTAAVIDIAMATR